MLLQCQPWKALGEEIGGKGWPSTSLQGTRLRWTAPWKQNKEPWWFYLGEERWLLAKGYVKDKNMIKRPKLNPVTVTVTPVFPLPLAQAKACRGWDKKIILKKGKSTRWGNQKQQNFQCRGKGEEVQETKKKGKEDPGTRVGERPVRAARSMHERSMLMKGRLRQAFGQGVGDIKGTPTLV